jgi:putative transposase
MLNMLRYKAEEAGSELLLAPTRELKPSQRSPACGAIHKKRLEERIHDCSYGRCMGRDGATARVLLNDGLARSRTTGSSRRNGRDLPRQWVTLPPASNQRD